MQLRLLYIIGSLKQPIHSLLALNNSDKNLCSGKSIELGNPMTLVYGTVLGGQQVCKKMFVDGFCGRDLSVECRNAAKQVIFCV